VERAPKRLPDWYQSIVLSLRNPPTNIHLGLVQLTDELVTDREVVQPFWDIIDRNVERVG